MFTPRYIYLSSQARKGIIETGHVYSLLWKCTRRSLYETQEAEIGIRDLRMRGRGVLPIRFPTALMTHFRTCLRYDSCALGGYVKH